MACRAVSRQIVEKEDTIKQVSTETTKNPQGVLVKAPSGGRNSHYILCDLQINVEANATPKYSVVHLQ